MTAIFSEVRFYPEGVDNPHRLDFIEVPNGPPEPQEMLAFRGECEQALRIILLVFEEDKAARMRALNGLHMTAVAGTVGNNPRLANGRNNLNNLKREIEGDAYRVRSAFLKRYSKSIIAFIILFILGYVIYYAAVHKVNLVHLGVITFPAPVMPSPGSADGIEFPTETGLAIASLWIPAGAIVGVLLEFVVRTSTLSYDKLADFHPGRWRPIERFFIIFLCSYVVAAVVGLGIFEIGVVNRLLSDFRNKEPAISILIGFITGFAFPVMLDILKRLSPEAQQ